MLSYFSLLPVPAVADTVDIPNEFSAGTPAIAAEVNANFDAIEVAVNDNDARLTTNDARLTTVESAVSAQGPRLDSVESTVSVHEMQLGALEARLHATAAVPGSAFRAEFRDNELDIALNNRCIWGTLPSNGGSGYFLAHSEAPDSGGCNAVAAIQLPDIATLDGLNCSVLKSDRSTNFLNVQLKRISLADGSSDIIYDARTTRTSSATQRISDSTTTEDRIVTDNSLFAYYIRALYGGPFDFTQLDDSVRLYGCVVSYQQ